MLTIVKSPPEYNLSKSPMICELSVNTLWYTENIGNKAFCTYGWTGFPLVGDTFVIQWASGSVTFTFQTTLNPPTNTQIRTNIGGLSDVAYTQQVVADILTNTTIASLFNVTSNGYIIEIRAKNAGSTYTFSNGLGSAYADFYNQTVGTDNNVQKQHPNFGVMVDLMLYDAFVGSSYKTIYTTFKKFASEAPVANVTAEFNVSDILNAFLKYDWPDPGTGLAFQCDQVLRRFFLRYREFWGEPSVAQFSGITPTSKLNLVDYGANDGYTVDGFVLKGGFSQKKSRLIPNQQFTNYYFPGFIGTVYYDGKFLTRQPRTKKIKRHQPEYLYFILPQDYPMQLLQITLEGLDITGKVVSGNLQSLTIPVALKNSVWCFPINYPGSYIESDTAVTYRAFVATSTATTTPISEVFTYVIDEAYSPDEKILMFTNSDGGVDTVRLKGKVSKSAEYDKDEYFRDFDLYGDAHEGEAEVTEATELEIYTASTGFITKDDKEWLRDLFLAKEVVEYDLINGTYIPVKINNRKVKIRETQQNLYEYLIEYVHAFNQPVNDNLNYLP